MTPLSPSLRRISLRSRLSAERSGALRHRLTTLVKVLLPDDEPGRTVEALLLQASRALGRCDASTVWLAIAVITTRLPEAEDVVRFRRHAELNGADALVAALVEEMSRSLLHLRVEVAVGEIIVDVNHLARTTLTTGIQRVTQRTVSRWCRDHSPSLVRWTDDELAMRRTSPSETARVLGRTDSEKARDGRSTATVVVPWRGQYLLPEVALEVPRTSRIKALVQYSQCSTAAIGFDAVPLTSAETTDTNVPAFFMRELGAIRHMDRVACISAAAEHEYLGWRTMLSSLGVPGPDIREVVLPVEAAEPTPADLAAARDRYTLPGAPLVLCVGSHEPRKNHLAVLHAAELLWRKGHVFTLLFVGGNAWHSGRFHHRLNELRAGGRSVEAALGVPDTTLWALYRLARCTVFPSLNEGFGLPVAESLASGTPAVTSDFGSMREIGAAGGALLVDPRNAHAIADAIGTLLTDGVVHARLVREAAARPARTWDDYARETWDYMVNPAVPAAHLNDGHPVATGQ
jgi:glycosyltransferase involved in cell wall biosynthesis